MTKKLCELLSDILILQKTGDITMNISAVQCDSRKVSPGDLFVAVKGGSFDGHNFINEAVQQGACAVVVEKPCLGIGVPFIQVGNTRQALARIASAFYNHPSRSMMMIGITGTNGKTSTAYLIDQIVRETGIKTGLLGTVIYRIGGEMQSAEWTTPESLTLQYMLYEMVQCQTKTVVMEVSSHSLEQYRVEGIQFRLAVFTNLTQDHLDYHRSMEEYAAAKQKLFKQVHPVEGENIVNGDEPASLLMARQNYRPVVTYSIARGKADVYPEKVSFSFSGIQAVLRTPSGNVTVRSSLMGRHNLYNIMAAVCAGVCLDIPIEKIEEGVYNLKSVPGRLETVNESQPFAVLIDFAHTPDGIEKAIGAVKGIFPGRIITVFGCGGDRDRTKRPLMGRAAVAYSDIAVLTSDNPRSEPPMQIIDDVLNGLENKNAVKVFVDRTEAVHYALDLARKGDCVLLLGKGHENYQIIGTEKIPYSDRDAAENYLREKFRKS